MPPIFRSLVVQKHARIGVVGDLATATEAWLIFHGYGMLAQGILHWFRAAERPGRVLVAPEGLSRFYVEDKGTRRVAASWLTSEEREVEIRDQLAYLDRVVSEVIGPVKFLQVHGFSQGVAVGARWTAHTTQHVRRLACWAGRFPEDVPVEGLRRALRGGVVDFVVGDDDQRVLPSQVASDAERLRGAGHPVVLHHFKGGHRVDDQLIQTFGDQTATRVPSQ